MKTALIILAIMIGLAAIIFALTKIPSPAHPTDEQYQSYLYRRCVEDFTGTLKDPAPCNNIHLSTKETTEITTNHKAL